MSGFLEGIIDGEGSDEFWSRFQAVFSGERIFFVTVAVVQCRPGDCESTEKKVNFKF